MIAKVIKVAVGNRGNRRATPESLLERRRDEFKIPGDMISTAASIKGGGVERMALLLGLREDEGAKTPKLINECAELFGEVSMALLVDRETHQVIDTSKTIRAVDENDRFRACKYPKRKGRSYT